jgi:serine/threonine-protein kinase
VGRQFALKIVPASEPNDDVSLEAKFLNISSHPNIVQIKSAEYWSDNLGKPYFLIEMEYVSGGNMQSMINKGCTIFDIVKLMKNVFFALDHAHPKLIHRDIKPANILLGGGGKLSDFGIAMLASSGLSPSTKFYNRNLAPECCGASPSFSVASDIYAAGLTLLRGLNLISDWKASLAAIPNWRAKMAAGALIQALGFHTRVPVKLKKIVTKACASDPKKRYSSAAAFRDALESLIILRDWKSEATDRWSCIHAGAREEIIIDSANKTFRVQYFRNGRRKLAQCSDFLVYTEAERFAYHTISQSSLG